jgi:amino acid transporter
MGIERIDMVEQIAFGVTFMVILIGLLAIMIHHYDGWKGVGRFLLIWVIVVAAVVDSLVVASAMASLFKGM